MSGTRMICTVAPHSAHSALRAACSVLKENWEYTTRPIKAWRPTTAGAWPKSTKNPPATPQMAVMAMSGPSTCPTVALTNAETAKAAAANAMTFTRLR